MEIEILQYTVEFWWREGGSHELDKCSIEHIKGSIGLGNNQGKLCQAIIYNEYDRSEIYGWWKIAK